MEQFRRLNVMVSEEAFAILCKFQRYKSMRNKDTALDNFIRMFSNEKEWKK